MTVNQHPLPVGTRVRHIGQQWSHAIRVGTGNIIGSKGPYHDGAYEYLVRTTKDFSRRSSDDNPETSERWWASYATVPATAADQ